MLGRFIFKIIRAWWYFFSGKNRELMKSRLSVCHDCSRRKWIICGECGCELHAKASDPNEYCPLAGWTGEHENFMKHIDETRSDL